MPLLHREPFVPSQPPADLDPDEEVFVCQFTKEAFRDYESFFDRTVLCNSLVWTCEYTGRTGLTYQEAVEREERCIQKLSAFPAALHFPVLLFANRLYHTSISSLAQATIAYFRDHFMDHEVVAVECHDNRGAYHRVGEIVQVSFCGGEDVPNDCPSSPPPLVPSVKLKDSGHSKHHRADGVAADWRGSHHHRSSSSSGGGDDHHHRSAFHRAGSRAGPPKSRDGSVTCDASDFLYKIRFLDHHSLSTMSTKFTVLSRHSGPIRKDLLELFFRKHMAPLNGSGPLTVLNPVVNGMDIRRPPVARYVQITTLMPLSSNQVATRQPSDLATAHQPQPQLYDRSASPQRNDRGALQQDTGHLPPSAHPDERSMMAGKRRSAEDELSMMHGKRRREESYSSETDANSHSRRQMVSGREYAWRQKDGTPAHARGSSPSHGMQDTYGQHHSNPRHEAYQSHRGGHNRSLSYPQTQPRNNQSDRQEQLLAAENLIKDQERELHMMQMKLKEKQQEQEQERIEKLRAERQKEQERKRAEHLARVEWKRPRDDLLCDDLKPLPASESVTSKLPVELVGDALMLCEFITAFSHIFTSAEHASALREISLGTVESALCDYELDGPLLTLLQFLLGAVFQTQEMLEADEAKHGVFATSGASSNAQVLAGEGVTDGSATHMAKWCLQHHGIRLRDHEITALTVSEMLRMHLLAVGGNCTGSGYIHRSPISNWQRGGGFSTMDDACVTVRSEHPGIIRRLLGASVVELSAKERCIVMTTLCQHLVVTLSIRDCVEESFTSWRRARQAWKDSQQSIERLKRSEAAVPAASSLASTSEFSSLKPTPSTDEPTSRDAVASIKREDSLVDSGAVTPDPSAPEPMDSSETVPGLNVPGKVDEDSLDASAASPDVLDCQSTASGTASQQHTPRLEAGDSPQSSSSPCIVKTHGEATSAESTHSPSSSQPDAAENEVAKAEKIRAALREHIAEQEKQRAQYQEEVGEHVSRIRVQPLGRDRFYRKYWVFRSQPGLFIETDYSRLHDMIDLKEFAGQAASSIDSSQISPVNTTLTRQGQGTTVGGPGSVQLSLSPPSSASSSSSSDIATALDHSVTTSSGAGNAANMLLQFRNAAGALTNSPLFPALMISSTSSASGKHDLDYGLLSDALDAAASAPFTSWTIYKSPADLDNIIAALNLRGFRERALADTLKQKRNSIVKSLKHCDEQNQDSATGKAEKESLSNAASAVESFEKQLRESILSLEDRLWNGCMGSVAVGDRATWRAALQEPSTKTEGVGASPDSQQADEAENSTPESSEKPASVLKHDHCYPSDVTIDDDNLADDAQSVSSEVLSAYSDLDSIPPNVKELADAILKIEECIDPRFLKCPLANTHRKGETKAEQTANNRRKVTVLQLWRSAVSASQTLSQIALNLQALVSSIRWERSVLNARCRTCRRKTDAENMLLCDYCNGGYHLYCLKPPLSKVPAGDWFCVHCRPSRSLRKDDSSVASSVAISIALPTDAAPAVTGSTASSVPDGAGTSAGTSSAAAAASDTVATSKPEETSVPTSANTAAASSTSSTVAASASSSSTASLKSGTRQTSTSSTGPATAAASTTSLSSKVLVSGEIDRDICFICRDGGELLLCDTCPRCYHLYCTNPPLAVIPDGDWVCQICASEQKEKKKAGTAGKPPSSASPVAKTQSSKPTRSSSRREAKPKTTPTATRATSKRSSARKSGSAVSDADADDFTEFLEGGENRRSTESRGGTLAKQLKLCETMWRELKNHAEAGLFLEPVSADRVPDYHVIIKRPMDLGTIKQNLKLGRYSSAADFITDVRQIFVNCAEYNPTRTREARSGVKLSLFFETRLSELGLDQLSPQ
eukprot:scpid8153/ scgid23581/ Bromodomain adjacent to zinc finger domain protein 1A; Cbp146